MALTYHMVGDKRGPDQPLLFGAPFEVTHGAARRLPRPNTTLACALRAGDGVVARRIDANDRLHRAVPSVHRVRRGASRPGRRRQRLPRLPRQLHVVDPRARASRGRRGGRGAGPARVGVRRTDRDGGRARGGDPPACSVGGTAALHELRHRGHHVRHPGSARVHRPVTHRQVRSLVPRHPRRRDGRDGGRPRGDVRPGGRVAVGRPRRRSRPPCEAGSTSSPRSSSSRSRAPVASARRSPGSCPSCGNSPSGTAPCSSSTRSSRSASPAAVRRSGSASART